MIPICAGGRFSFFAANMLTTAIAGAIMAISISAPPGPVTMETVRRGLGGGFRPALYVQLGSVIGDLTWCALALLGLAPLVQIAWVRGTLSVAGVALLLYLGVTGLRDAFGKPAQPAHSTAQAVSAGEGGHAGAFRSGLAISMANPMAVGYWLSVGGALIAAGIAGSTPLQIETFVGGYLGATLAWCFIVALAVRWGKRALSPALFRWFTATCSCALLIFGLALAARLFGPGG
jgi:chemosensory pili system protein ChpE